MKKVKRVVQPGGNSHTAAGNPPTPTLPGPPGFVLSVGGLCGPQAKARSGELESKAVSSLAVRSLNP